MVSCNTDLLLQTNFVAKCLNSRQEVHATYTDLAKAFVTSTNVVLSKLSKLLTLNYLLAFLLSLIDTHSVPSLPPLIFRNVPILALIFLFFTSDPTTSSSVNVCCSLTTLNYVLLFRFPMTVLPFSPTLTLWSIGARLTSWLSKSTNAPGCGIHLKPPQYLFPILLADNLFHY